MRTLCALALVAVTTGCIGTPIEPEDETPSGPPGGVELRVSPTLIAWEGPPGPPQGPGHPACPLAPRLSAFGPFAWTIRESRGGTITVNTFTFVTTAGGQQLRNGQLNFAAFTGSPSTTLTLTPNQSIESAPQYSCQTTSPLGFPRDLGSGGETVFTVSGTDSLGNPVTATTTLNMAPFP